jgi:hypothetical protein
VPRAGHLAPIFVGRTVLGFTTAVVFLITGRVCINIISGIRHELFTRIVLSSERLHLGLARRRRSSQEDSPPPCFFDRRGLSQPPKDRFGGTRPSPLISLVRPEPRAGTSGLVSLEMG